MDHIKRVDEIKAATLANSVASMQFTYEPSVSHRWRMRPEELERVLGNAEE